MALPEKIHVEVAYARPDRQLLMALQLPAGATLAMAIEASGLLAQCPEIDLARDAVGVFSAPRRLHDALRDGDRVEIYRALQIDPKQARRERAARRSRRV